MPAAEEPPHRLTDHKGARISVTVRLTPIQHELLRRRLLSDRTTVQTVLSAAVNAYALGDLRVNGTTGRYWVESPAEGVGGSVPVRVPTQDDPDRVVTLEVETGRGARTPRLGTQWLTDHLLRTEGKRVSPRMLRLLLAWLEDHDRITVRSGRTWRFDGPADPTVLTVREALHDGTWTDLVADQLGSLNDK